MPYIPFNKPSMAGKEWEYLQKALENMCLSGNGPFGKMCEKFLEERLSFPKVLMTTSCTHALEMCAMLLDIKSGDEVIIPSFTFVSTVNAFILRGAIPVFIDIRPDTQNLDENLLEDLITPQTKAIIPVHYAGVGCEMEKILKISQKHNVPLVEDNAHGLFGKYKGKYLGSFGSLSTLSFHETKNFICGEGGSLLVNDPSLVERAEILREKGTDRSKFFRGEVDKYTWVDMGSSYVISDLLAAFLYAQLEQEKEIQEKRKNIWNYYYENLSSWAKKEGVRLPVVPGECDPAYHMFYLILPSEERRNSLLQYLKENQINSVFHYQPLHLSKMAQTWKRKYFCPETEKTSACLLRLPFYNNLTREQQDQIIERLLLFP